MFGINQRGAIGGRRATSDPRPFVTKLVKLFVKLLLIATVSFILFSQKDLKEISVLISSAAYVQVPHFKTVP
jgi:hypothetical protein